MGIFLILVLDRVKVIFIEEQNTGAYKSLHQVLFAYFQPASRCNFFLFIIYFFSGCLDHGCIMEIEDSQLGSTPIMGYHICNLQHKVKYLASHPPKKEKERERNQMVHVEKMIDA